MRAEIPGMNVGVYIWKRTVLVSFAQSFIRPSLPCRNHANEVDVSVVIPVNTNTHTNQLLWYQYSQTPAFTATAVEIKHYAD